MPTDYLLGIDLGTSGVKALLLPADLTRGTVVAEATAEYPLLIPQPGWSEQQPDDWWQGVCRVIHDVLARAGIPPSAIAGLALSGQMHGATLLDAAGAVLRPAILWNDQRTGAECAEITERIGLDHLLRAVANPALPGFTAPKILWVRNHEPAVYARLATVLLPKDYINYRLTGVPATEVSDASGTLLFDVAHRRWSDDVLHALAIPPSFLPTVHASTDPIGMISAEAARATGLQAGTPVIAGGADNACAAVGMGVVRPGQVLTSIGTSGTVVAPTAEPLLDPRARLHMFCHAVPDTWYLMGVVLSAGGSLRWFRDTFAGDLRREDGIDPYDLVMAEAASVPPGSAGLIFLPYLTGERTPHGDPDARGVFFGLSLGHTRAHLARAVIEGVTYALADSAALMRELGVAISSIRATGGGARSPLWRQIQADVLEARVLTAHADLGPAFGAAILAGVGSGVFPSVQEAADALVAVSDELDPDAETIELYRRYHAFYDSLYPALKEPFAGLSVLLT